ncbi:hypothetical protein BJ875DRAFT_370072 [Amylocarpus encephaloides]|uniref:Glucose-methanol-choline oxidoreductase N-terminal domain-containing protein n=1 Tax=Amylocarpus encephaloides TaxID=45428 RepID=A0A9P7YPH3_9HELO|nr:hypothetical protein BJ875DRAFT_370072 [Amylocarpus encephaloides]
MWFPFSPRYPERRADEVDSKEYDYIVVGGGTAGCALASRLSEDPEISVLLLERGPVNDTWLSRVPLIGSNILTSDWGAANWLCEPMKFCNDRRSRFFCGEVLGGGSRINGMVYTRGTAADFNAWGALGHPEWSYDKVLPYFVKSEKALNQPKSEYRGDSGPWITRTFPYLSWPFRVYRVFVEIAEAMGFVRIIDTNSPDCPADGIALFDSTVNEANQRVSTLEAYLPREIALQRRGHLTICANTLVSQITSNEADRSKTHRAEKVLFKSVDPKTSKVFSAKVKKEVIVCSGAIGSPQVLMLSGIGPREHLEQNGIKVVRDLPGVGSELTDHIGLPIAWETPLHESLAAMANSPVLKGGLEFMKYVFFGSGLLSIPVQTLSIFARTLSLSADGTKLVTTSPRAKIYRPEDHIPDLEIMPLAINSSDNFEEHQRLYSKIGIFSLLATLLQPKSRGTVRLASLNPHDRPKVDFGLLSDPEDFEVARTAIRLSLKLGKDVKDSGFPLLRNLTFSEEDQGNDEKVDEFIRDRARTTYHYASTCRMAAEDDPAPGVVDDELRVHGFHNLRVCDASVFPKIVSSHLQAPVVMAAEKLADMIKKNL